MVLHAATGRVLPRAARKTRTPKPAAAGVAAPSAADARSVPSAMPHEARRQAPAVAGRRVRQPAWRSAHAPKQPPTLPAPPGARTRPIAARPLRGRMIASILPGAAPRPASLAHARHGVQPSAPIPPAPRAHNAPGEQASGKLLPPGNPAASPMAQTAPPPAGRPARLPGRAAPPGWAGLAAGRSRVAARRRVNCAPPAWPSHQPGPAAAPARAAEAHRPTWRSPLPPPSAVRAADTHDAPAAPGVLPDAFSSPAPPGPAQATDAGGRFTTKQLPPPGRTS